MTFGEAVLASVFMLLGAALLCVLPFVLLAVAIGEYKA